MEPLKSLSVFTSIVYCGFCPGKKYLAVILMIGVSLNWRVCSSQVFENNEVASKGMMGFFVQCVAGTLDKMQSVSHEMVSFSFHPSHSDSTLRT